MSHTPMVEKDRFADLESALSRLREWVDDTAESTRVRRPPTQVTPQLPVPSAPVLSPRLDGDEPVRTAAAIVSSAAVAAMTTAVTFAFFVVLSMVLLPVPARPSLAP